MLLDAVVRCLGFALTAYVIVLVVTGIVPSYVPAIHPIFMSIGVGILFSQGLVAYTANFGSNFRRRGPRRSLHGTIQMFGSMCVLVGYTNILSVKGEDIHPGFMAHYVTGYMAVATIMLQFVIGILKFRSKERDGLVIFKWHAQLGPLVYLLLLVNLVLGVWASMWPAYKLYCIILLVIVVALAATTLASLLCGPRSRRNKNSYASSKPALSMPLNTDSHGSVSNSPAGAGVGTGGGAYQRMPATAAAGT